MTHFLSEFTSQIAATSLLEWVAVVLAIAYVLLAAKQNSWCWLCALSAPLFIPGYFGKLPTFSVSA